MNQVVSFSGGKDSTAMLLMMLERGEQVDAAVYFDAGEWEFPQMAEHIAQVGKMIAPVPMVRLEPRKPFVWSMIHKEVRVKGQDKIRFYGWGWPSPLRRWCTREKCREIDRWCKENGNPRQCVGYAAEEAHRSETVNIRERGDKVRFPLIEWGVTEPEALEFCKAKGFDWGGLYDIFPRVSCFCCPLQSLAELRKLRKHFPALWAKMLQWESQMPRPDQDKRFKHEATVHDLDARFAEEDRQLQLPGMEVA